MVNDTNNLIVVYYRQSPVECMNLISTHLVLGITNILPRLLKLNLRGMDGLETRGLPGDNNY